MGQSVVKETVDLYKLQGVELTGRELGKGSYCKVFEVQYRGTLCAAKEIDTEKVFTKKASEESIRLLVGECFYLSALRHPNIIQFIGIYGSFPNQPVMMVMEKMDYSLWQYVQNTSPVPLHSILSVLHDVSLGLWYLHNYNPPSLHRYLSPHHVLISNTGPLVAKICGFKMIKELDSNHEKDDRDDLTTMPETSDFIPPEALTNKPIYGLPLDIFSYGGVALFAVGGEWPAPKDQSLDKSKTNMRGVQRRQQYLDKMIGEAAVLKPLVEECLSDNPLDRPTISDVSTRIKNIKENYIKQNPQVKLEMMGSVKEYHHLLQSQLQYANEQILEKNRQIVKKDELICLQDQEIYNKNQVLQLNYQELQKKVQEIQKKNQRIQKSNQEIQKRNLRIQQRDTEIQQRDQLIQQKHEELWQVHQEMKLQLQQRYQEFQQKDQLLHHTTRGLRHKDMQLLQLNEEIQQEDQQIQLKVQEMQDTWKEIQQQIQQNDQKIQQYDKKLQEKSQEITQKAQQMQALQVDKQTLQQQVDELQAPTWVIRICDIRVLDKKLGTGGWGSVCEAILHGCKVAVKSLDHNIISQYNLGLFSREMNMAARCRHPNLLQFIGATNEGVPLIVTELMHTSVRKILEQGQLCSNQIISISLGVAHGLNYLHKTTPDPIIHRDVSSANVLLNPLPNNQWHPKLSDFGSTNFMRASNTISAGNPAYAAPEALSSQGPYTPAMDVFSFGVLMFEMCSREFPAQQPNQSTLNHVKWKATEATLIAMIRHCLALKYTERPAMEGLIKGLSH